MEYMTSIEKNRVAVFILLQKNVHDERIKEEEIKLQITYKALSIKIHTPSVCVCVCVCVCVFLYVSIL